MWDKEQIEVVFLLVFGVYIMHSDWAWIRTKSNHFSQEKSSTVAITVAIPIQIKTVENTDVTATSNTAVVNINVKLQVQSVKSRQFITSHLLGTSLRKTGLNGHGKKRKA